MDQQKMPYEMEDVAFSSRKQDCLLFLCQTQVEVCAQLQSGTPGTLQSYRGSVTVGKKPPKSSLSLRLPFSIAVLGLWNTRWLTEETNGQHQWVGPVDEGCSAVNPCSYRHSGQMKSQISWKTKAETNISLPHICHTKKQELWSPIGKNAFIASISGDNPQKDPLHQLCRHEQTTIFRLSTGHYGQKGHLALGSMWLWERWSNTKSLPPTFYNRVRQHIWPVSTTMDAKLWASANDLHLTTHFATLTGQRIWHNQSNEKNSLHVIVPRWRLKTSNVWIHL